MPTDWSDLTNNQNTLFLLAMSLVREGIKEGIREIIPFWEFLCILLSKSSCISSLLCTIQCLCSRLYTSLAVVVVD